ncbi:RINT1-like protein MAG2 isoform X1 [Musa acuminata AAA Group]|uniref:RINT1-like protein MAG2 isoform X1 n=1 Tax=Musa acuminata AAA Group TaxID=214697 RepID=UPI0031D3B3DA
MEGVAASLPRPSDLSPSLVGFLAEKFRTPEDLPRSPDLEAELTSRCSDLEASLADLSRRLAGSVAAYAVRSEETGALLGDVRAGLVDLRSSLRGSSKDGGDTEDGSGRREQMLADELPALAKEVARVETVRSYAETTLKLDRLIGDVEDAVSSSVTGKLKTPSATNSVDICMVAINSLKQIEDMLASVTKSRPQWSRLVSAVDHRVDRALSILRPQAIADHRNLLASLGWPPPLSGSNIVHPNTGASPELYNPLFLMTGNLKIKYCENFLSLCKLQELQRRRKSRQLSGHTLEIALSQPLWVVEELVNPIMVAAQHFLSKWHDKPEFIFALVYKLTMDFVASVDEILQPLVDKAMLVGRSCREEWISAMVTSLSTFLSKEIFPKYVDLLEGSHSSSNLSQARLSWLHLVDLMISFDKRIQTLITNSGLVLSLTDDANLQRVSSMSIFCDRPDWLQMWAEIELGETVEKLRVAMHDEKSWKTRFQGTVLMTGSEDYKSPAVSGAVLQGLSLLIDRSRPLPSVELRARFIRLAGAPIVREFLDCLLRRCQEAEGLTALADDDALLKVSQSINSARHFDSGLTEWCENVFFLEMESIGKDDTEGRRIFEEEITMYKEFRTEWIEKIATVVLRGFDSLCRDYLKNRRQWQEKTEGVSLSKTFVTALDYIQGKISKLEEGLNAMDFVPMWRAVASGVDQLVFSGVFLSSIKFNSSAVERLNGDLEVLFGVFSAWCLRPQGFLPRLAEGLKLLKMEEKQLKDGILRHDERWLRENGIKHLTIAEAEKIVKNTVVMG